jgi:hypothetical protein
MRSALRRAHWRIWLFLPWVVGALFIAALVVRPTPLGEATPVAATSLR